MDEYFRTMESELPLIDYGAMKVVREWKSIEEAGEVEEKRKHEEERG